MNQPNTPSFSWLLSTVRGALVLLFLAVANVLSAQIETVYNSSGTFVVPAGVTQVTVECWGGGGRGATRSSNGRGGGGGGAAYARSVLTVTSGNYTVTVGAGSSSNSNPGGDSWFGTAGTILAKGGSSAANNSATGANGGSAGASIGTVKFAGGDGADAPGSTGAGGGSSAGTAAAGADGSGQNGGTAPTGGGDGGDGGNAGFFAGAGAAGTAPGGGGGGAEKNGLSGNQNGGNGATGRVIVTYQFNYTNGTCMSAASYNAIPDNGCGSNNNLDLAIPISGLATTLGNAAGNVRLTSVDLIISHTYNRDVHVTLIAPGGSSRALITDRFGSGDNLGNPANCPNSVLSFVDGGTALTTTNTSNVTGNYAPEQTLAGFTGNPNGDWVVRVCDNQGADVGNLRYVKLNFQTVDCLGALGGSTGPGSACNDGNACTINDVYNAACTCAGTFQDTDGDGTCNANDGCPNDGNKIAPGVCGCGVSDADTDLDGTANCNDGCPNDANKIAPGICGCGVADTDTDLDGTANCNDGCPIDANKIAPGLCGCGVADTDTDLDGTADCNDGCPSDPNKIAPGVCGCGASDVDTDLDGTANCNDGCPNDANKIAPGICGCGVSDVDNDLDGTADCNDGCPTDANKIAPGICGCGVADTDTDLDGTADCNDLCPSDPLKTAPGQCGCDNLDTDTDLDGTADCNDGCPTDPDKIAPGVCGCETPDIDSDGDGLADCVDPCVDDVNNTDTDSDGTPDCTDNCPLDANKVNPGTCGCGAADTDTDGDTYADCADGCPTDADKIAPGVCGCGVADADSDNDGSFDCVDGCPNDANKVAPGVCGCGTADTDTDGDSVADCNDNCPNVAGQIGSTCDDNNAGTMNDVITGACVCAGTSSTHLAALELTTDNDAASTSWDIIPLAGGPAVCGGGGYTNSSTEIMNCQLPDGCYRLRVFDANMDGLCCMNGMGGYVLRTTGGQRIIDAAGAGIFSNTAEVALGFCVPIGGDHLTPSRCDRENYLPSDFIQATPNAAVQAQFNVGVQSDDGYQFWIFNPNGGYSRRVLITHATNNYLFPLGADRCSYLKLNSLTSSQIPHNMLVNVRVRSMVNGIFSEFGSACRLKIDLTNQCPTTQLIDDASNSNNSCGLVDVPLNGSRTLYAVPVSGATSYQFEFSKPGFLRKITSAGSNLLMTQWYTMPLQYNSTYNVRVRVSFDSGANYCPFGTVCTVSTTGASGNQHSVEEATEGMDLSVWPNPNHGGIVTLNLVGFGDESEQEMTINVVDLFGKQVYAERLKVQGDILNTTLDMQGYAAGIYLVNVTTADHAWTKRVIVQ